MFIPFPLTLKIKTLMRVCSTFVPITPTETPECLPAGLDVAWRKGGPQGVHLNDEYHKHGKEEDEQKAGQVGVLHWDDKLDKQKR